MADDNAEHTYVTNLLQRSDYFIRKYPNYSDDKRKYKEPVIRVNNSLMTKQERKDRNKKIAWFKYLASKEMPLFETPMPNNFVPPKQFKKVVLTPIERLFRYRN